MLTAHGAERDVLTAIGNHHDITTRGRRMRSVFAARVCVSIVCLCALIANNAARAGDDDDDEDTPKAPKQPNVYLDLNSSLTSVPPDTLALGFRSFTVPLGVSSLTATVNAPLTVDINERLSVYGGVSALTSRTDLAPWSSMVLDSWNVGFNADIIQQAEGRGPTVTVISTFTRTLNSPPGLTATSNQTVIELDYALDQDQMRGVIAGTRVTAAWVDSGLATIRPAVVGYVGGYYQWDSNWKLSGRFGVQTFGGAQIAGGLVRAKAFTQPLLRIDLDRMDDNDNRLFGASVEVAWTPDPIVQFTLRTPLYAVRN
jgi:opacity protein-like surface antigen